jgi:hypothetical protein
MSFAEHQDAAAECGATASVDGNKALRTRRTLAAGMLSDEAAETRALDAGLAAKNDGFVGKVGNEQRRRNACKQR